MGSKDNQTERDEEPSTVRLASEVIVGILKKDTHSFYPSSVFGPCPSSMLATSSCQQLFACILIPQPRLSFASLSLVISMLMPLLLKSMPLKQSFFCSSGVHKIFNPILEKFACGPKAATEFNRLAVQLAAPSTHSYKLTQPGQAASSC